MPYAPLPEQIVHRLKIFARIMLFLTILGILISLPFAMLRIGLVGTIPLSMFLIVHIKYLRALNKGCRLSKATYRLYILFAFLGGLASVFGFYMFALLQGVDQNSPPFFPFIFLSIIASPTITYFTIRSVHRWNKQFG